MRSDTPYDESYPTCSYTHVWLRVMDEQMDPDEVTRLLGLTPTTIQHAGERRGANTERVHKVSGWFLSTEDLLTSLDARHHLDWLLERIGNKAEEFAALRGRGYLVDACCRWDSSSGHGGPTLSPTQMLAFGRLGIELWFDIYFDAPDDAEEVA